MMVRIDDNVPVVMLVSALVHEGFELVSKPEGLVLRLSTNYTQGGMACGQYVPSFLRHQPEAAPAPADFSICPTV